MNLSKTGSFKRYPVLSLETGSISLFWVLCLSVSVFLRFWALPGRGLIEWDDGHYMMEARFFRSIFDSFLRLMQEPSYESFRLMLTPGMIEGWPVVSAKPGQAFLIFAVSLLLGMEDYTGLVLSAATGVLTTLVLYFWGKRFYGRWAGLIASISLAVSGIHVMYSRSPLAETSSAFFFALGAYGFLISLKDPNHRIPSLVSGFLFGYGLTANYRWFFVAVLLLSLLILWARFIDEQVEWSDFRMKFVRFLVGALVPIVVFQIPYVVANMAGGIPEDLRINGYWQSLYWFYTVKPGQGNFSPHSLYLHLLLREGGLVVFCLALCGVWRLAATNWRRLESLLVLVPLAVPLIVFSLTTRGDRLVAVSLVIPFFALAAGIGAQWLAARVQENWRRRVAACLFLLILLEGGWLSSWNLDVSSGWGETADYVRGRDAAKLLTFQAAIAKFYLGRENVKLPPRTRAEAREFAGQGFRYLAVDWKKYHADNYSSLIHEIESQCRPVRRFRHAVIFFPIFVDDFHFPHPNSKIGQPSDLFDRIKADTSAAMIAVYDMEDFLRGICSESPLNR